jgi:hypothetical protein
VFNHLYIVCNCSISIASARLRKKLQVFFPQTFCGETCITQWNIHHRNINNSIDYKGSQAFRIMIIIQLIGQVMCFKLIVKLGTYRRYHHEKLEAIIILVNMCVCEVFSWTCDVRSLTIQCLVNAMYIT